MMHFISGDLKCFKIIMYIIYKEVKYTWLCSLGDGNKLLKDLYVLSY